jgi:hypothetical protein
VTTALISERFCEIAVIIHRRGLAKSIPAFLLDTRATLNLPPLHALGKWVAKIKAASATNRT